jgi:ribosomal protein L29
MFNPLITNLSKLTETQLEQKVIELQRKYFQTYNMDLQYQIATSLDMYKEELYNRRVLTAQKQREQLSQDGKDDLDNLININ